MYKKTIEYTDYDGNKRKEDFFFNLNKSELIKWETSITGGMRKLYKRIIDTRDRAQLIKLFEDVICRAYGEKSPDGKYFNKSPEILARFMATEAYDSLFMELASDDIAANEFLNGIIPPDVIAAAEKAAKEEAEADSGEVGNTPVLMPAT